MPRFVILRHDCPAGAPRASHWDFMLEWGPALRTWALPHDPRIEAEMEADALADHRLEYLEFQGELSGGRGTVQRDDRGEFDLLADEPAKVSALLRGEKITGRVTFVRRNAGQDRWRFSLTRS